MGTGGEAPCTHLQCPLCRLRCLLVLHLCFVYKLLLYIRWPQVDRHVFAFLHDGNGYENSCSRVPDVPDKWVQHQTKENRRYTFNLLARRKDTRCPDYRLLYSWRHGGSAQLKDYCLVSNRWTIGYVQMPQAI